MNRAAQRPQRRRLSRVAAGGTRRRRTSDCAASPASSGTSRRLPLCVSAADDIADTGTGAFCTGNVHTGGGADAGWISYDHCVVDGPPAPAQIVGLVTDDAQKPLCGCCGYSRHAGSENQCRRHVLHRLTDRSGASCDPGEQAGSSQTNRTCSNCRPARTAVTSR